MTPGCYICDPASFHSEDEACRACENEYHAAILDDLASPSFFSRVLGILKSAVQQSRTVTDRAKGTS